MGNVGPVSGVVKERLIERKPFAQQSGWLSASKDDFEELNAVPFSWVVRIK
jgi:hypothetical protein